MNTTSIKVGDLINPDSAGLLWQTMRTMPSHDVGWVLDTTRLGTVSYEQSLENCTNAVQMPLLTEGERDMAKHRMRTCIGYNDDGTSVIKQISASSELELADKIVRTYL